MLFVGFGLFARANATVIGALLIGALSVSSAIFLILELNHPYLGLMRNLRRAAAQRPGSDRPMSAREARGLGFRRRHGWATLRRSGRASAGSIERPAGRVRLAHCSAPARSRNPPLDSSGPLAALVTIDRNAAENKPLCRAERYPARAALSDDYFKIRRWRLLSGTDAATG
jgi:hypothetical protein